MDAKVMRHFQVTSVKNLFDQLIDRHAEAYLEAHPEIKEFSNFEKSGTGHYYIGMIWASEYEKLDLGSVKLRGSQSIAGNSLVELDLSALSDQQSFFPGQIIAFLADPFTKRQLTIRRLLDPMSIAPRLKTLSTDDEIRLFVAAGPFMKPEQDDWILLDKIIEAIKEVKATHVILLGPFVDMENKFIRSKYDVNWRLCFDSLCSQLYDHNCSVYLVPSTRDVLPHYLSSTYFYPISALDFEVRYRENIIPQCRITSVSDPSQIDIAERVFIDVTSAEVLFHLNKCASFINKGQGNTFTSMYKHILTHGIYPIYPPPSDVAIDYPRLSSHLNIDRLGPHILVLPTRFKTSVIPVDGRLVVAVQKCSTTKQAILITIPKIDGSGDTPINSVVDSGLTHKILDLCASSSSTSPPLEVPDGRAAASGDSEPVKEENENEKPTSPNLVAAN